MCPKIWIVTGALLGAIGVGFGAYHAHGLEKALADRALPADKLALAMENFDVGVRYELYHAIALVLVGLLAWRAPSRWLCAAGILFLLGTMLFSWGLFFPVLSGTKLPWFLVPIGGLSLIVAWVLLALGALLGRTEQPKLG
jgi:uncharacterized membrane protein YgdD (TMEM256/DUF423 family)